MNHEPLSALCKQKHMLKNGAPLDNSGVLFFYLWNAMVFNNSIALYVFLYPLIYEMFSTFLKMT